MQYQIFYQTSFSQYRGSDISGPIRFKGGDCGGGSESLLVIFEQENLRPEEESEPNELYD